MLSLRNLRIVMKPSMANNLFKHALSTTSSLNAKVAVVYKNQWRVIGLLLGLFLHFVINLFVVLSGCGVYDGSEVHEASAVLVHLSRHQSQVSMFAPDIPQMHAIDHTKGEPMEHNRNVLTESARIARGKIQALSDLNPKDFDAVVFPGGFGAAKNLSTFAVDGTSMKVNEDVEKVIKQFHSEKKAIGMCCIVPVLAAKVIQGCEVTVGSDQEEGGRWPYAGTAGAVQSMGSTHIKKNVTDIHVDEKNKLVTTPAFMCETAVHEIYDGIGKMIEGVLKLAK